MRSLRKAAPVMLATLVGLPAAITGLTALLLWGGAQLATGGWGGGEEYPLPFAGVLMLTASGAFVVGLVALLHATDHQEEE